ncbi:UNVERIFIED_CONTAM: hypothetical protein RMT77_016116 [Armadillidium vulgare]
MSTSRDERGSCSTDDVFDEAGNKSVVKSESLASCSSIQDLSESVRSANSTFSTPNVDSSNQNRVASGSKQKTVNTSSRSISQQSVRSKLPTIVTKSDKKSEKLPSVTTTKSSTFVRNSSNRTELPRSSERRNSICNVSKNFVTENKAKASLPAAKVQSRRSSFNPKTPTTSTTTGSTRRSSLPGQVDETNQTKNYAPINQSKVKEDHKGFATSQRAKALETVSTQRKNIGINVSQPTRTALQAQKKTNIHQSQIQDSDAATDQKRNKFNKSPVINIQNSKQNLQSQTKPQYRSPYSFNKENSLKTLNTSGTNISSKSGGQSNVNKKSDKRTNSQNEEKISASSSEKAPRTNLPHVTKTSKTLPESSTSVNSKTLGKCVKESANKLPPGRKNAQTANEDNLTVPNKSQETLSLAITPPLSENSDVATEFSTEEQTDLHMNCTSSQPVEFPSKEENVIDDQGNNDLEFLDLKETGNEKFSVDEVQNSSMISEKGNEDLLNPDDSEIPTILFDTKTSLEPGDLKDFPYSPNQQNAKEAFLRAKKTSKKTYLHAMQIVMETFFGAKKTSMKTYQENEEALMEILFQAEQVSPEHYYKIDQAVFSFCSKIEKRNIEERLMMKREVEEIQSLIGNEKEAFQAKKHEEIVNEEDGEESKNSHDFDSNFENSRRPEEDFANVPKKSQVRGKLKSSEEKTEKLKKSLQDLLEENRIFSEKSEFEILYLKNTKDAIESSLKNKKESIGLSFLHNEKEIIGEPFLQSKKNVEIALGNERDVTEILNSLQNEREEKMSFLQNEEVANEIEAVEKYLQNDKDIQLPLQVEIESVDMSHLPKDEAVELPFLQNVKKAIEVSLQKEKEVIDTALKELKNSRETSLQNKSIESSLQNEGKVVEKALKCEEAVDMPSQLEEKEEMEISLHENETVEMCSSQNSKDIQLPLQSERESVDMSYLPNDDAIEMPFLQNVRNAVGIFLQKEQNDLEIYLQKVKKTADTFFQNEKVELSSQNERVVHIALQCDKETIDMSHEDQDSEMSLHQERDLEISLHEDKTVEMTSLQNNKEILSSQIERESVDMSYLPNDDAVELPFLHDVKASVEIFLQKEKDADYISLQNVKKVTEISQNEETVQTALQHEEAVEMSSLHERGSEMSSLHEEMSLLHENETVETSLQDNKDIQLPLQIEGESVDMSYLPDDDAVELPFLQNVKEAVEVFLQKEDDAVNTSLQNMEKVLETSQNEEIELSSQNEETVQISLQCEEAVGMSSLHDEGDIEMSLHENDTVRTSLQDNKDIQLPLQIEGESVDMSYLPDDDGVELPFLQNVKEAVEVFLQKEDADVNASLQNVKKVLVTSQNEEVIELSSQNENETVQIDSQRENETVDMSPLYEDKEDIEISLQDKKAETSSLLTEKVHEISLHDEKPDKKAVQTSSHDKESIRVESLSDNADEMSLHMETEKSYLCKKDVKDKFSPNLESKTISVSENKANVTSNMSKNIDNDKDIFVRSPYDETAKRIMFSSASKDLENPEKYEMPKYQKINENEEVQNKFSKQELHVFKESTVGGQNDGTVGLSDTSCENKTGGSEKCNEVIREEASCMSQKPVLPDSPNQNVCKGEPIYSDRKTIGTELNIEVLDFPKKDTVTSSNIPGKEINPDKVNILPDFCIPSDEEIQHGLKEDTLQNALNFLMNETID